MFGSCWMVTKFKVFNMVVTCRVDCGLCVVRWGAAGRAWEEGDTLWAVRSALGRGG